MKNIRKKVYEFNWLDVVISIAIAVVVFLAASRDVINAIAGVTFFVFLSLRIIERKIAKLRKEFEEMINRTTPSTDATETGK